MGVLGAQFWILDPLYSLLGTILAWFYAVIPSYAVAIILLTVAVRLVTLPLTAKQAKSQQALQKVQPEMKRLQAKYKNDKQKLNEEMMKFYKENHINPFGACLPLFLQMPVLIVLYRLIIGLTGAMIIGSTFIAPAATPAATGPLVGAKITGGTITGGTLTNGVVTAGTLENAQVTGPAGQIGTIVSANVVKGKIANADVVNGKAVVGHLTDITVSGGEERGKPKHVPKDSRLYKSLVKSGGTMESFGMNLSKAAAKVNGADVIPYMVLVIAVVLTGYWQQRQLTARSSQGAANQQAQMIGKIFPLVFGVISFSVPAGVVVYFLVSNVWQVGQQAWIFRNQDDAAPVKGKGSKDVREAKVVERPAKSTPKTAGKSSAGKNNSKASARSNPKRSGGATRGSTARTRGNAQGSGRAQRKRGGRPADLRGTRPADGAVQPRGRKRGRRGAPPASGSDGNR